MESRSAIGASRGASGGARPLWQARSLWDRCVGVFVLAIQQGAFVSTPLVLSGLTLAELRLTRNPFNAGAIAISMLLVATAWWSTFRRSVLLLIEDRASCAFISVVLMSAAWSVNPEITLRRGAGYVLTLVVAAQLAVRFDAIRRMEMVSSASALSAIGCVAFVAAFPEYGIMQGEGLAGAWRGVFAHKNVLGPVFAVAVFSELFILAAGRGRPRWRWGALGMYLTLVVLSRSATAVVLSVAYVAGYGLYVLRQRDRLKRHAILTAAALFLCAGLAVFWSDPAAVLSWIGRDVSLTGRRDLWSSLLGAIEERPLLGWGYQAAWQAEDGPTASIETEWGAGSAHNAFLDVTLQVGVLGAGVMSAVVALAFRRGLRCQRRGAAPLGWFSTMFFVGTIVSSQTMNTLGQNQVIDWVVFNALSFGCGLGVSEAGRRQAK